MRSTNRYSAIIAAIFAKYHQPALTAFDFRREDIVTAASELGIPLPKNIGDVLYSFRYRANLPTSVTEQAPEGYEWVIRPVGKAQYRFALVEKARDRTIKNAGRNQNSRCDSWHHFQVCDQR